jgi:hypothetical protein
VRAIAVVTVAVTAALTPWAGAFAFTVGITAATTASLYLRVGSGTPFANGNLQSGGTPTSDPTINVVSTTVPAAAVGNATTQAMGTITPAPSGTSYWDGYAFCSSGQLYIGGFYRTSANGSPASTRLQANVPAALTTVNGDAIPFSQISWTSSGNGDTGSQPFAAGTFVAGGTQTIGTIARNQWAESCHSFRYANSTVVPSGTYAGRVTYTLSSP